VAQIGDYDPTRHKIHIHSATICAPSRPVSPGGEFAPTWIAPAEFSGPAGNRPEAAGGKQEHDGPGGGGVPVGPLAVTTSLNSLDGREIGRTSVVVSALAPGAVRRPRLDTQTKTTIRPWGAKNNPAFGELVTNT